MWPYPQDHTRDQYRCGARGGVESSQNRLESKMCVFNAILCGLLFGCMRPVLPESTPQWLERELHLTPQFPGFFVAHGRLDESSLGHRNWTFLAKVKTRKLRDLRRRNSHCALHYSFMHRAPYREAIISCPASDSNVSISGRSFAINATDRIRGDWSIAVAVSTLFGDVNCDIISAWLKYYTRLGVSKFLFYTTVTSGNPPCASVTNMSGVEWTRVPSNYVEDMWYHGQLLTVNDALLRASGSIRWIGFVDFDEFLTIPSIPLSFCNLSAFLDKKSVELNSSALAFRPHKYSVIKPWALHYNDEERFFRFLRRQQPQKLTKIFVRPDQVKRMNVHHISGFSEKVVSVDEAVLQHFSGLLLKRKYTETKRRLAPGGSFW